MDVDPWLVTTYTSDGNGVANFGIDVADFTLNDAYPVAGRVVVVHDAAGERTGCGVLDSTAGEIATLGAYPGVTSTVTGTALVAPSKTGVVITSTIGGLEAGTEFTEVHIHSGFSVDATADNGGNSMTSTSVGGDFCYIGEYTPDVNGVTSFTKQMGNFTINEGAPVLYHPLVVYNSIGTRTGAGIIATQVAEPARGSPSPAPTTYSYSYFYSYDPSPAPTINDGGIIPFPEEASTTIVAVTAMAVGVGKM
jgi:Cu/Zn superoxide dismutase